jgi:acyl-CoA synthetase (AMP-forming)/AMP-acid ligase II
VNIGKLLERNATRHAGRVAFCGDDGAALSYARLHHQALRIAHRLRKLPDVALGDRVAMVMDSSPASWACLFGTWYAGMVAVPVLPASEGAAVPDILAHAGARVCVVERASDLVTTELLSTVPTLRHIAVYAQLVSEAKLPAALQSGCLPDTAPNDIALLDYYDTCPARPLAAMVSHRNLWLSMLGHCAEVGAPAAGERVLHGSRSRGPLLMFPLACLARGAATEFVVDLEAACAGPAPERGHPAVTVLGGFAGLRRLADAVASGAVEPRRLRSVVYTRDAATPAELARVAEVLDGRLVQVHGRGVTALGLSGLDAEDHAVAADRGTFDSIGRPRLHLEVEVRDVDGQPLPAGITGTLVARGDGLPRSVWRDRDGEFGADDDGWLSLGEFALFDRAGYLHLHPAATATDVATNAAASCDDLEDSHA